MNEEININNSPGPVNILGTKKILNQMMNCICKIKIKGTNQEENITKDVYAIGFFCKVALNENDNINCLMTNYHILNEQYFKENKELNILFNDNSETKKIDLNIKRIIYYNKEYDTTIIELKEEDNIKEYLEIDDDVFKENENMLYEGKSIYIIQYGEEACVSYGILNKINENYIINICSIDNGSLGSPILNLETNKVIGIHKGARDDNKNFNYGTLLKYPLNDFISKNKTKNIIIGEIYINKNNINKDIQIINSFENVKREKKWKNSKDDYLSENEKEIKENIEITINKKIIEFTYYYKFKKERKYTIEYSFKNSITKTNHMFRNCNTLINLNLSNFNTNKVSNMSNMFYDCNSLKNLNLSNFKTQNVNNMSSMLDGCKSLTNLNLSNFNTQNVTDMSCMFRDCYSLSNLNLSNFNTQNVTNMSHMFCYCSALIKLDLSNFNTQSVTNMSYIFEGCKLLTNLNLSNFNTQNVTNMNEMFRGCNSLNNLNLSNFNTQNVINMSYMFAYCNSLNNLNLSNFNIQKVTIMSFMFSGCYSLNNLNLSNFNSQNVNDMSEMFTGCRSLKKNKIITKDNRILKEFDNKK